MSSPIFSSERSFVLFSYSMSHGLLLLRSRKSPENPKRLEILFQDVRAMEIRCWFEGLTIEEADADLLRGEHSNPAQMIEHGNKIYCLRSSGWSGFIVGGIVSFNEDGGELFAPTRLVAS